MGITDGLASLVGLGSQNPYGPNSVGQWNLSRGIYTRSDSRAVTFFYSSKEGEIPTQKTAVENISDSGGRRLAIYEYPYKDGQRVADLGRKGETLTFSIKFFGLDYQRKFKEFLDVVVNSNLGGIILHPVRGAIPCRFRDYEIVHKFDEWNAVNIKAVFVEDNSSTFGTSVGTKPSTDASLRDGINVLAAVQSTLSAAINDANLLLVAKNTLKNRLGSVLAQVSQLLGELTATFSSNAKLVSLMSQANTVAGGITSLSSGKETNGSGTASTLPPIFQVGFDETTQATINAQSANFVNANTVTPQQAVFNANQARQAISAAITEAENTLGLQAYTITLTYRQLAVAIQSATEAAISSEQSAVILYTVPQPMSLRMVAEMNGLDYDRQNDLEALNPYLQSINYISAGTVVTVPAS